MILRRQEKAMSTPHGSPRNEQEHVPETLPNQSWGEDPSIDPAVNEHLRSLVGATQRLWKALKISPRTCIPGNVRHSKRVALFSLRIARDLKLSEELSQRIYRAAYLHDVGKIALSPTILRKTGRFTAEERRAMQVHSLIGHQLLGAFLPTEDLAEIALSHHERYDGDGYPNGLQGGRIPLAARVLAIADSLDAVLSRHTGRNTIAFAAAWREITQQAGRQFDPCIVDAVTRPGMVARLGRLGCA